MQLRRRPIGRRILLASLLLALGVTGRNGPIADAHPAFHAPAANTADNQAMYRPEVRLRKLHLVRPDLIPYPIAYEVYC